MLTRAYSICRRCAAVYPDGRRCPACEGDQLAARAIAEATAHAIEQSAQPAPRRRNGIAILATAVIAMVFALGAAVAAIAGTGHAGPGTSVPQVPDAASGAGGASQVRQ